VLPLLPPCSIIPVSLQSVLTIYRLNSF
jgi:hypothetical protein